jgi:hypothetical protein
MLIRKEINVHHLNRNTKERYIELTYSSLDRSFESKKLLIL